jgi:hypothetical protein
MIHAEKRRDALRRPLLFVLFNAAFCRAYNITASLHQENAGFFRIMEPDHVQKRRDFGFGFVARFLDLHLDSWGPRSKIRID